MGYGLWWTQQQQQQGVPSRSDFTTSIDYPLIETYDWGREKAHRVTFRRFEQ